MAFSDLIKAATDFAVLSTTPEAETVEYSAAGAAFTSIGAQVDRTPEILGESGEEGLSPIHVAVSKTDITQVNEGRDRVRLSSGDKYRVEKVLEEDGGGFLLYCAP